jgi:hypothetical protein
MRQAVLVISLLGVLVLGLQSCAVSVGGSVAEQLSTAVDSKAAADSLSSAGALGLVATLMWVLGAGFVLGLPKVSVPLFAVAGVLCIVGGAMGFTDLFVWGVVSFAFALMSFFGVREKARDDALKEAQLQQWRLQQEQMRAAGIPPPPQPWEPGWQDPPTQWQPPQGPPRQPGWPPPGQ